MRRIALTVAVPILVFALVAPAAADGGRDTASAFAGSCQLAGVVEHDPPLTNTPAVGELQSQLSGPCWGTWTTANGQRHQLAGDVVRYAVRATSTLSCAGGTGTGKGHLHYRGDFLGFDFGEIRGPGAAEVDLTGHAGGAAGGLATVSPDEDPLRMAMACSGEGLRSVRIDLALASPGIAG